MVWMAWRIYRESGSPILFRQTRVGYKGKPFRIVKFRTMSGEQITPFGNWLRATAMDELPQLFHILKGQMSFVGPRPLIPEELQQLHQIPDGLRRLSVRPGLAGLAQLTSDKIPSLSERVKWDCQYVTQCSPWLDAWILVRSVGITCQGAWERSGAKIHRKE